MEIIETERLLIRQIGIDDANFIIELLNDPSFIQNIGDRKVRNVEDARAYVLNGPVASYAKNIGQLHDRFFGKAGACCCLKQRSRDATTGSHGAAFERQIYRFGTKRPASTIDRMYGDLHLPGLYTWSK